MASSGDPLQEGLDNFPKSIEVLFQVLNPLSERKLSSTARNDWQKAGSRYSEFGEGFHQIVRKVPFPGMSPYHIPPVLEFTSMNCWRRVRFSI